MKRLKEKVEDIVYKKAKEEIEFTARTYLDSFVTKVMDFFIKKETQAQKIERISKEISERNEVQEQEQLTGVIELYSSGYFDSLLKLMGVNAEKEDELIK